MAGKRTVDLQKVLTTAIALANESGVEAVTLASVAAQLGIRNPSMYNHVSGLPGLRYEMALWGVRQLGDVMRRAAVGKAGDEAIVAVADAYRAFALAQPGIYPLTQRPANAEQPELAAAQSELVDICVAILAPYGFEADDKIHAVRAMRSVLHGFVDLEASGGFGIPLDRDASFRQLVDLFIVGLRARQTTQA